MHTNLLICLIVIAGVAWCKVESCTSCGSECTSACGTRRFRTCCFNYLKKRNNGGALGGGGAGGGSDPPIVPPLDPGLRLELWLAKSRIPAYLQRDILDATYQERANDALQLIDDKPMNE